MIKVLHLMRSLNAGGIGTFVLNNYRVIDKDRYLFDFAITHEGMGEYGDEIERLGGHIYFISTKGNRNIFDGIFQLIKFYQLCRDNGYDVVHCHYYFANAFFILAAKLAGVKVRISHCHNTRTVERVGFVRRLFELISRYLLLSMGTDFLGCADAATVFLYGKRMFERGISKTIYNGIDYDYWDINKVDVNSIRKNNNIKNEKVLLFVGRLEEQKNPLFALQVINLLHDNYENIKSFFIGEGSFRQKMEDFIKEKDMSSYVELLPADSNIRDYQAIADVMIAPSLWEGLSIAFIEAQKMHTMVFTSDMISYEVDMGLCKHYPLDSPDNWARVIADYMENNEIQSYSLIAPQRFDVKNTKNQLELIYTKYFYNRDAVN